MILSWNMQVSCIFQPSLYYFFLLYIHLAEMTLLFQLLHFGAGQIRFPLFKFKCCSADTFNRGHSLTLKQQWTGENQATVGKMWKDPTTIRHDLFSCMMCPYIDDTLGNGWGQQVGILSFEIRYSTKKRDGVVFVDLALQSLHTVWALCMVGTGMFQSSDPHPQTF